MSNSDSWPALKELTPSDLEKLVVELFSAAGARVSNYQVQHLEKIEGDGGSYKIDAIVRFELIGVEFIILVECKHHGRPVERADIQVLDSKIRDTRAHKGIFVSTSAYDPGALFFARHRKIALIRLVDGALSYETKSGTGATNKNAPSWLASMAGTIEAYEVYFAPTVHTHRILTNQPNYTLGFIATGLPGVELSEGGSVRQVPRKSGR